MEKLNAKKKVFKLGLSEIIICYLAFCFSTISYRAIIFSVIALIFWEYVIFVYYKIFRLMMLDDSCRIYIKQLYVVNCILFIVFFMIVLRGILADKFNVFEKIILIEILFVTSVCCILYIFEFGINYIKNIKAILKYHYPLIVILIIFGVLTFYKGGTTYKWDSNLYYVASQRVSIFSISSMALYGHISQTVGFLVSVLKIIFNDELNVILLANIVSATCGIVGFYGILRYECTEISRTELFLATSMYTFSPYILGLVNYFSLDYFCATLFPLLIYFLIKKQIIYYLITAILFCFTKEPAIIVYCSLFFIYVLLEELMKYEKQHKIAFKNILRCKSYYIMCLPIFFWLTTYILLGPWSAGQGGITIDFKYIISKLSVIFIFNFSWLFTILSIGSLIYIIYRKKISRSYIYIIFSLSIFTLFSCLFKTANHYRYNDFAFCGLLFLTIYFVINWKYLMLRITALIMLCIISFCSVYLSLDFVTDIFFPRVSTGNGSIWTTSEESRMADSSVYNKQMLESENVINKVVEKSIMNQDIIILQSQNNNLWYADGLTEFKEMDNEVYRYAINWDSKKKQRINIENEDSYEIFLYQTKGIKGVNQIVEENIYGKKFFYLTIAGENEEVLKYIEKKYHIITKTQYVKGIWKYDVINFGVD